MNQCKVTTPALWLGDLKDQIKNNLNNSKQDLKNILLVCILKNIEKMNDIYHIHYKLDGEAQCRCMKRNDDKVLTKDEILAFSSYYIDHLLLKY